MPQQMLALETRKHRRCAADLCSRQKHQRSLASTGPKHAAAPLNACQSPSRFMSIMMLTMLSMHYVSQIYIPDDDIIQMPSSISRAFDIQEVYGLELAQPTLCSRIESETVHGVGLYKEGPTVLRYVTFVEIMVPLFSMDFFKGHVVQSLATSASGTHHPSRCKPVMSTAHLVHVCCCTAQFACNTRLR